MRVDSMYAQQKSGTLTQAMTEGRSRFHGSRMILRNEGIRGAVRTLREGIPFYFLPDMDLGARDAVFVPFFGVPAATVTSVARLAKMTHAVIVPCVTLLTERGYAARFYPPWEDFPGDDVEAATRRMNAFIEERVLEAPEQYLWSHKRFKSRPEGEPGLY
jgi:KDO2-lipid IV(A) lauroyltransferase